MDAGANEFAVRQALEMHVLNSVHIVMTTLGSAGGRILESADKFEVVVGKFGNIILLRISFCQLTSCIELS